MIRYGKRLGWNMCYKCLILIYGICMSKDYIFMYKDLEN